MEKSRLLPTTRLGRWAAWLMVAFFGLFLVFQAAVFAGQRGGDAYWDNLVLAIPMTLAAAAAVAGAAVGLVAAVREKDLSAAVITSIALGAIVAFFVIAELVPPFG